MLLLRRYRMLDLAMGSPARPARPGPKKPVQARPDYAIGPGSGLNFGPDDRAGRTGLPMARSRSKFDTHIQ